MAYFHTLHYETSNHARRAIATATILFYHERLVHGDDVVGFDLPEALDHFATSGCGATQRGGQLFRVLDSFVAGGQCPRHQCVAALRYCAMDQI